MTFLATKNPVEDQGRPPDVFLSELVLWARTAPDELFAPNNQPDDVFGILAPIIGNPEPKTTVKGWTRWNDLLHRRCAITECIRGHAGMETGWNWRAGVDTTNPRSVKNIAAQETGIVQVSWDGSNLGGGVLRRFLKSRGIETPEKFIPAMKSDHALALEYYVRLVRISYKWAGPLKRVTVDSVRPYLSGPAVAEFRELLTA